MSVWLDEFYLRQVSRQLPLFKDKGGHTYNARCVICGDSSTNKNKARWYAFPHKNVIMTKCHNCGYSQPFGRFLEEVDPLLYQQYTIEKLADRSTLMDALTAPKQEVRKHDKTILQALQKVSQLSPIHPAKRLIDRREIPCSQHYRMYYTDNFQQYINTIIPNKFANIPSKDCRIVMPLLSKDGKSVIGMQGRAVDPNIKQRYITIILDNEKPKLYGLDQLDMTREILVVEGPIDSMFVNNCIASCGSDLTSDLNSVSPDKDQFIVVYDNEPRNKQIIDKIAGAVRNGYTVTIWPDTIKQKDINDMVLAGMSTMEIRSTIKSNTFSGLSAELRLSQWRKV